MATRVTVGGMDGHARRRLKGARPWAETRHWTWKPDNKQGAAVLWRPPLAATMPGFERAATIDRPPQQVYAVIDDVPGCARWMPVVRKVEPLTPGPVGVGYRWRETRRVFGPFTAKMELEITEHQPPKSWGLEYNDGKTKAVATFLLERSGAGTLITLREDVEALDGNGKRVARMAKMIEKADDDLLRRLKAYVESLPRAAEPETFEPVGAPAKAAGKSPKPKKARAKKAAKPKAASKPKKAAKKAR